MGGGDFAAFLAARLAAGNGDALLTVQAQGAAAGQFGSVANFAAIAVVLVVAAADAAPGGFVIAHRFGVGGFLHPDLDLVICVDRQIALGVDLGTPSRDIAAGFHRQFALAAQFTGLQAFAFVAAAPTAGAQAGGVVALIAAFAGLIFLHQPGEVHIASRFDAQRPVGADAGAQQVHVFPSTDEFGVAAGGDGAARLLQLLAFAGDVVLPGIEPAVVGVTLSLLQLLAVERQLAALQGDVFAANIGGGEVRVVIRHQADVLAFQLGAGQLLAAAAIVDVDAATVILIVIAAVFVAAGIFNAAFAANIVGFHLEFVAGSQRAGQLHAAALRGVDDVDAPGLHAAEVVAVQRGRRLFAGQHLAVARHAVKAADGVDRRRRHFAVAVGEVLYDDVAAAVYLRCDQIQHAAGVQGAVEAQGIAVAQGAVALQQAVFHQRVADHQRGAAGVDEPAALAADAVRVGQHVVGRHAEDLLLAVQQRRVAADHFIKDHTGFASAQIRVGTQLPGQLRQPRLAGVVQHRAGLVDVEVLVLVMRQSAAVRRDDVDHLGAGGGGGNAGAVGAVGRDDLSGVGAGGSGENYRQRGGQFACRRKSEVIIFHPCISVYCRGVLQNC